MISSILPKTNEKTKKNQPNITMIPQVNFFLFVFGRIEDTIICFRDLMTFSQTIYSFRFLHPNHFFQSEFLLFQLKPLITTEKEEQRRKLTPTVRTATLLFVASGRGILLIMPRPQTFCFQKA
jgi:hypothetical protein